MLFSHVSHSRIKRQNHDELTGPKIVPHQTPAGTRLRVGKVTLNDIIYPMASFSHHRINFLLVPTSINHAPYPENGRDDEANGEKRKENQ